MNRCGLFIFALGCSEYGLGSDLSPQKQQAETPEGPLLESPAEETPGSEPGSTDWDDSCEGLPDGVPTATSSAFEVIEPIEAVVVLLTAGSIEALVQPGPLLGEVSATSFDPFPGPLVQDGTLLLDLTGSSGEVTLTLPPELASVELRLCTGHVRATGLSGQVEVEVRVGEVILSETTAREVAVHNGTGDTSLSFSSDPSLVRVEGDSGMSEISLPSERCDCDLDSQSGTETLSGIENDPTSPVSVWARRKVGEIIVSGL